MDLRHVRYFISVAEAGSFVGGARRAYVKQPTLSAAIAALEAELGGRVFERHPRGVSLTPFGERALRHARALVREAETLSGLRAARRSDRPLRVGLLPTLPPEIVAGAVQRLRHQAPERVWRTEDGSLERLRQRLSTGRYDVILTSLGAPEAGRRQLELARDAQALAAPAADRVTGPITPAILEARPLIVRTHCEQLQTASRILDEYGVRPLVVARTDSDGRALAMVGAGLGWCLMPDSWRAPGVHFLRPEGVDLPRRLGFEWIRGAADGLIDEIL